MNHTPTLICSIQILLENTETDTHTHTHSVSAVGVAQVLTGTCLYVYGGSSVRLQTVLVGWLVGWASTQV